MKRHNARERHGLSTVCRPGTGPLSQEALGLFMAHRPGLLEYASDIPDNAEYVARMAERRYAAVACRRRLAEPVACLYRIRHKLTIDSYRRRQRQESMMEPGAINIEQTSADKTPTPEAAATIRHQLRLLDKALAERAASAARPGVSARSAR